MKYLKLYESFMEGESLPGVDISSEDKISQYESKPIILIGPQGTGKSTTAKALSKKLGIPLVTTDMSMVDEKYENMFKDEPGVEVSIKRHPTQGMYYDSNDKYVFCVLNKLMEEYGDKKIVLDVGGTHAYVSEELSSDIIKLYSQSPNLFVFNVSDDEDESYELLKKRREGRGEETKGEDDKKFRDTIDKLKNYYKETQKISIINKDKSEKTTDELVDDIISKLK
jgi:adenylate kinase family enzyme